MATLHKVESVLIEDRASGTQLIQELQNDRLRGVEGFVPSGDKQMRLWAQTACMEMGRVHLPKEAPWLDDYLREPTSFPNSRHDDQVDSTTQALAWVNLNWFRNPWLELAKEEMLEAGLGWNGSTSTWRRRWPK